MWADAALYSCSGPLLPINQPLTVELKQGRHWERDTCWEQVFTCGYRPHLCIQACTPLIVSPLYASGWAPRSSSSTLRDVRDAWPPNIATDHKCPYVSVACISRKTVTHLISQNQKLQPDPGGHPSRETFSLPELTVAPVMVMVEFSLLWFMWRISSPVWISFCAINEHIGSLICVSDPSFLFFFFFSFVYLRRKSHINCTSLIVVSSASGRKTDTYIGLSVLLLLIFDKAGSHSLMYIHRFICTN